MVAAPKIDGRKNPLVIQRFTERFTEIRRGRI